MMKAELQAALDNPDRPEAQAILNRISRYASVIKGARPIGTGDCPPSPDAFITLRPADFHRVCTRVRPVADC